MLRYAGCGLLAAGLFSASVAPLRAADMPQVAPAPLPVAVPDWNGFYIGGHVGVDESNAHYNYSTVFSGQLNNHTSIGSIRGPAPGVYGGYNYQVGSFVFGVEGEVTFTNGQFRLNGPNFDFLQHSDAVYGGSARAGILVTPTTLVYGKLGAVAIELSGNQGFTQTFHATTSGAQVGGGIESLITNNITARVEADYISGTQDLVLNQGFDHYRPSFFWVNAGLALKLDPLPQAKPVPPQLPAFVTHAPRWTSIYVGGLAGIAAGEVRRTDSTFGLLGPYNDLRFTGGAVLGGDIQLSRIVLGAQVDSLFLDSKFVDDVGVGLGPTIYHQFAHLSRISAVTGRAGFLVTPSTLIYGKAGPAQIRFTPEANYFAAINPSVTTTGKTMSAIQYGGGMETYIADHVAVRVEGLYTHANDSIVINGIVPAQTRLQPSALTGTVGLVFKL